jgi:hypothetical protein
MALSREGALLDDDYRDRHEMPTVNETSNRIRSVIAREYARRSRQCMNPSLAPSAAGGTSHVEAV